MAATQTMSKPELVAHLLKNGGRILLAGDTKGLPESILQNPRIVVWDTTQRSYDEALNEVPSNVRVLMWNRWVSHRLSDKLNQAARDYRAVKFPMLRTREIKELLSEITGIEPQPVAPGVLNENLEAELRAEREADQQAAHDQPSTVHTQRDEYAEEDDVAKKKAERGSVQKFVAKYMSIDVDYTEKGSIKHEAKRLYDKAKSEGVSTTENSIAVCLGRMVRTLGKRGTPPPRATRRTKPASAPTADVDDFAELDSLIQDAIVAMKLVQEHLPKVRKETERMRAMREKMLALLG